MTRTRTRQSQDKVPDEDKHNGKDKDPDEDKDNGNDNGKDKDKDMPGVVSFRFPYGSC
jgi:hypothetical protein